MKHTLMKMGYTSLIKPVFFHLDPELVHNRVTAFAEFSGNTPVLRNITKKLLYKPYPQLKQNIAGITFPTPIGLAAGFDYEARLTQILPAAGFGFQTVGTITNHAYEGNPTPRLGRLPQSKSLLVNKGFKNRGAIEIAGKLSSLSFETPLGISIGRTNNAKLSQQESIEDIINALTIFEVAEVKNAYYEINISCPNLHGTVTFYTPKKLKELLTEIEKLFLQKPVFIKMPIDQTNAVILSLLECLSQYPFVTGVIFGNLQKNRKDPSFVREEIARAGKGHFSGKPTWKRSNELISLSYRHYGERFVIIGCGGVFSIEDAYQKIKLGSSLVQLITGMIYEGPQLVSEINAKLPLLLKRDGFRHISEAIGTAQR